MTISKPYTRVLTIHVPDRRHDFLLFGVPADTRRIHTDESGARAVAHYFEPDSIFAYARQDRNEYGIVRWHTYVFRATAPGEPAHATAGAVEPPAECLVACTTKRASIAARQYVDLLQEHDLDPARVLELHRRAAPYLAVAVVPEDVVEAYADTNASQRTVLT